VVASNWTRALRITVATALALLVTALIVGTVSRISNRPRFTVEPTIGREVFRVTGISHRSLAGASLQYSISADEVVCRKRKVGPLTINPVREIVIRSARIRLGSDSTGRAGPWSKAVVMDLRSIFEALMTQYNLGLVTHVRVEDIEIVVADREGDRLTLRSGRLVLDRSQPLRLEQGVTVISAAGQLLKARNATLDLDRVVIDGPWTLRDADGERHGDSARFTIGTDAVLGLE